MREMRDLKVDDIQWPCQLSDAVKQSLVQIAKYRHNPQSSPADRQYAHERGVFYILKGCTASCFYITEPERSVGGIFGKGDWLGVNTINENIQVIASIEEIEPAEIIHFSEGRVMALAKREPEVYRWLFHCSKRTHIIWLQAFLSFAHNNLLQLCYILLDIQRKCENKPINEISITQQKLSAVVGCTRSKLNILLKKLESEQFIQLYRNKIILIDVDGLKLQIERMNLMVQDPRRTS